MQKSCLLFLFVLIFQFSPPLYIFDLQKDQVSMTAEMEIYCIASSTEDIRRQLQTSLARQGDETVLGTTILKIHHPGKPFVEYSSGVLWYMKFQAPCWSGLSNRMS